MRAFIVHLTLVGFLVSQFLAFAEAHSKEQMPGQRPTLVLSEGLLMYALDGPEQAASHPTNTPQDYVVVPAGQFLIVFRDKEVGGLKHWYLAATEKGLWGYVLVNTKNRVSYVEESHLRGIYDQLLGDQLTDSILLISKYKTTLGSGKNEITVNFTRGELYEVISTSTDTYRIKLTPDKKRDINKAKADAGITGLDVPDRFDIPKNKAALIDFDHILPNDMVLSGSVSSEQRKSDISSIFQSWSFIRPGAAIEKDCDVQSVKSVSFGMNGKAHTEASVKAEGAIMRFLKATFGIDAEATVYGEKTYHETETLEGDREKYIWFYSLAHPSPKETDLIKIVSERTCRKNDREYGIEVIGDEYQHFSLETLKALNSDLAALVAPDTGKATINCYRDYLTLRNFVAARTRRGIDLFLTRIAYIADRQTFFSASCSYESKPEKAANGIQLN